ncbi:MAG: ribose-phosphate pyrophosphokinase-like domain-containing protein [Fodinibius sp.]|nr:ribose-phosphate pyrophosphokinase-like domain-containing protein [Fodinibius sp.]
MQVGVIWLYPGLSPSITVQRLGEVTIKPFSDGELYVKYEQSIRGEDIFVVQSTPPSG